MFSKKDLFQCAIAMFIVYLALLGGRSAQAQEEGFTPLNHEARIDRESCGVDSGVESKTGIIASTHRVKPEISAETRALKAARKAGQADRVLALEREFVKPVLGGEAAGGTVLHAPRATCGPGDFLDPTNPFVPEEVKAKNKQKAIFGTDRQIRNIDYPHPETYQTLVTDSQGRVFAACANVSSGGQYHIQTFRSLDGGLTWKASGWVWSEDGEVREPCLAVGEGMEDWLLLAYIVVDPIEGPIPEVARTDPAYGAWSIYSVPVITGWEGYAKPVIWTDSHAYDDWTAYLACEGIFNAAAENINIVTWRSKTYGDAWTDIRVPLGNTDTDAWRDPDGSFGTPDHDNFIVCYNETQDTLYATLSEDFGLTWLLAPYSIYTLSMIPSRAVDPEIAAAVNHDHVMVSCTKSLGTVDSVGQTYSTDGGINWTTLYTLEGLTTMDEAFTPALTANEGGQGWHLSYTCDQCVYYSRRPQDLSDYWQLTPDRVDDEGTASDTFAKKGIASHWTTDAAHISWSDNRDGGTDTDAFYDYVGNPYEIYVPSEYDTIQEAIEAAKDGWTVRVAPGTYEEKIDFLGKAITVIGGGPGHKTVIDGMQVDRCVYFGNSEGSDSVLCGFTLTNGTATAGGAVCIVGCSPTLVNNVIVNNLATYGGALFLTHASPTLYHNTIADNSATLEGGGILVKISGSPVIRNSILWANTAPKGAQIYEDGGSASVEYCDVEGGWTGKGNIDQDPDFADDWPGDYHIHYTSPCRDAGKPVAFSVALDYEGDPRDALAAPDMGADEFHKHVYAMGDFVPGGAIAIMHVDLPKTSQVALIAGVNIFDPPLPCDYGLWYMDNPMLIFVGLPAIGADGIMTCSNHIPASPMGPYTAYLQGCMDYWLTNLCTVNIK